MEDATTVTEVPVKKVVMEEYQKKAFDVALDLTKQLMTLATGTLALTATFIKEILKIPIGEPVPLKWLLFITWGLMLLSIFCGLLAYGAISGTLDGADITLKNNPEKRLSPFNFNITLWAVYQAVIFYLGIVSLIVYVANTLT